MKKYFEIGIFLFIALCIEALFTFIGLPIRFGDLFLIGISILLIYILLASLISGSSKASQNRVDSDPFAKILLKSFYLLLLSLLGISLIYIGLTAPLKLIVGVKGSAHGYSLVVSGISIIVLVVLSVYAYFSNKNGVNT